MPKFTEGHEWLKHEDDIAIVGITEPAAMTLGDLVSVELLQVGANLTKRGGRRVGEGGVGRFRAALRRGGRDQ